MIKRLMTASSKRRFLIISQLLFLSMAVWLAGCINHPFIDDILDGDDTDTGNDMGKIVMHETGGFAGVSRITRIEEKDGVLLLVHEDQAAGQRKESPVSLKDLNRLWQTLEENDVFTLPTNHDMLETVRDGGFYEITVEMGEKRNQFSVYAPGLLTSSGETRYDAIVRGIKDFANARLQTSERFIVRDMPVTDISVELLESYPLQVHVMVNGYLSDSCTTVNETKQRRDGNTIHVSITTKRPEDAMCAQVITRVTLRVPIAGGFLSGRYKVVVNEAEKDFEIQGGADLDQEDGVVRGRVTIGPLCPVEPCDLPPEQVARIYEARKAIVYELFTKVKVAEENLDQNGVYYFSLRPGNYIVDISDAEGNELPLDLTRRPMIGNTIPKEVEIRSGEKVTVDFDIDTGIR